MSRAAPGRQRGIALVMSLLLLVIITILALSMFRGFVTQEHIAGDVREKARALLAAEDAEQYAEFWLTSSNNVAQGAITCSPGTLNANNGQVQICNTPPWPAGTTPLTTFPWPTVVTYLPTGMSVTSGVLGAGNDPPYALVPGFYITDLGPAGDGKGEAYQIDAYGTGSTALSAASAAIAIVESGYEVQQGVTCLGGANC